jgi:hypothetical protein
MAGGLLQVITYGTEDLSLTGNPQITFFHTIYRRYTNFGKKTVELSFNNSPNFDTTSYINIPKNNGDLLSKSILKIKLPKIDFTYLNNMLSNISLGLNDNLSSNESISSYIALGIPYYNYFNTFYNNLKNIIGVFFSNYDNVYNYLSYIQDLNTFILKYINFDQFNQFFNSINYFYNQNNTSTTEYNIDLYTNASLYYINNNNLVYVYQNLTSNDVSYSGFKSTIQKNMEILNDVNKDIYNIIKNDKNTEKSYVKFCWVNKIATYLFNSIDLYIGSNKIYSLSDTYINNYAELYYKNEKLYDDLIGNNTYINDFSNTIDGTILYLPIPFWHLSNYGLAFPTISLQFNSLQIKINTKKLLDCIRIDTDGSNNPKINNDVINFLLGNLDEIVKGNLEITLLLEYIYLDSVERNKFARSAHEYLIEQVQQIEFNNISPTNNNIQLDIFHCCKDMFWFVQKKYSQRDIFSKNRDVFNYIYPTQTIANSNINTNKLALIDYCLVLYNQYVLFDSFVFNRGLYVINNNLKYLEQVGVIIQYNSNQFIFPSSFSQLNTIILASNFYLNGTQLFSETSNYFNYLIPYACYNSTPQIGLNSYSFCLSPVEFQPTGSCNMSRISYIGLKLKINQKVIDTFINQFAENNVQIDDYELIFQTRNFNVLRIIGGIGATAYTYN